MRYFKRIWIHEDSIKKLQSFRTNGESLSKVADRVIDFYDKNVIIIVNKKHAHAHQSL